MGIVVKKFGGSSVATPEKIKAVADRVVREKGPDDQVVVTVSAMGDTTDELIALARQVTGATRSREMDMLLSTGEQISIALLAMAFADLGCPAVSLTGPQAGIMTNSVHMKGRICEINPDRVFEELSRGNIVVVAGFQGESPNGDITTLGRGGSDTTAVALSAALSADCEIYSDVDGVYSADPRVVADARHLPSIGTRQMQELADHGAKVLNAQAVEWAARAGIVIYARKTHGSAKQTLIRSDDEAPIERGRATAVTGTNQIVEIQSRHGAAILRVLGEHGVSLRHVGLCGEVLEVALTLEDLPDFGRTLDELRTVDPDLALRDDLGMVTAVGPGIGSDPVLLGRLLSQLRDSGFVPSRVTTSPLRISVWLPKDVVGDATRLLHALLC